MEQDFIVFKKKLFLIKEYVQETYLKIFKYRIIYEVLLILGIGFLAGSFLYWCWVKFLMDFFCVILNLPYKVDPVTLIPVTIEEGSMRSLFLGVEIDKFDQLRPDSTQRLEMFLLEEQLSYLFLKYENTKDPALLKQIAETIEKMEFLYNNIKEEC